MSATTPKKTTRKKTTKPAVKPGDKFEQFRERALATPGMAGVTNPVITREPFVLGEEQGFNPPIELEAPTFADRLVFTDATDRGDTMAVLRVVFKQNLGRVIDAITRWETETGETGELVLMGIAVSYIEHFYGKGAADTNFTSVFGS